MIPSLILQSNDNNNNTINKNKSKLIQNIEYISSIYYNQNNILQFWIKSLNGYIMKSHKTLEQFVSNHQSIYSNTQNNNIDQTDGNSIIKNHQIYPQRYINVHKVPSNGHVPSPTLHSSITLISQQQFDLLMNNNNNNNNNNDTQYCCYNPMNDMLY
eukprot:UN05036